MNFTVTSSGRQFDRLALMYLGDTEVFRTSTAEPTVNGIRWTYVKDMSNYLALFKESQKLIFDLGNLIDDTYTAPFNTTLTATFFTIDNTVAPADSIIPISSRKSDSNLGSSFSIPEDNATNTITLPQNIRRAAFTVSACGQADEEFWFGNVLSSDVQTFPSADGPLFGYSPFREVQLYIDGRLAGVQWPFPIIFTGGVVPGLWRPIVGIDAFDLREHEIDITPWLPILCDGNAHTFEIRVAGINDDGDGHGSLSDTVGHSWIVTGKIFLWLDTPGSVTTGFQTGLISPAPVLSLSSQVGTNSTGGNETLTYSVQVSRHLSISSTVITSSGPQLSTWSQTLTYSNQGNFFSQGNVQITDQTTNGNDISSNGYSTTYHYPVWVNTSYAMDPGSGNFTIDATITRGLTMEVHGPSVFPNGLQSFYNLPNSRNLPSSFTGSVISTTQNGSAHYQSVPALHTAFGFGTTEQDFIFNGLRAGIGDPSSGKELYHRHVLAVNGTVIKDQESLINMVLGDYSVPVSQIGGGGLNDGFASSSIRSLLGRGPGNTNADLDSSDSQSRDL
jgi:hypothetical protein